MIFLYFPVPAHFPECPLSIYKHYQRAGLLFNYRPDHYWNGPEHSRASLLRDVAKHPLQTIWRGFDDYPGNILGGQSNGNGSGLLDASRDAAVWKPVGSRQSGQQRTPQFCLLRTLNQTYKLAKFAVFKIWWKNLFPTYITKKTNSGCWSGSAEWGYCGFGISLLLIQLSIQ